MLFVTILNKKLAKWISRKDLFYTT